MDIEDQLLPGYWSNPSTGLCWFGLGGSSRCDLNWSDSGYKIDSCYL